MPSTLQTGNLCTPNLLFSCPHRFLAPFPVLQDSAKPPRSNIPMGDDRLDPFATSYHSDFDAPFAEQQNIRSPMRNKDLAAAGDEVNLKNFFKSAYNRVGITRIKSMLECMRERMDGKLGNINNNGFRTRRLFKMYDKGNTGLVSTRVQLGVAWKSPGVFFTHSRYVEVTPLIAPLA